LQKKLTITLDERVYDGLHAVVGRRRISRLIETLVRQYVLGKDLDAAYRLMAQDKAREAAALDWAESEGQTPVAYVPGSKRVGGSKR
jgi:hypothetical protein